MLVLQSIETSVSFIENGLTLNEYTLSKLHGGGVKKDIFLHVKLDGVGGRSILNVGFTILDTRPPIPFSLK